MGKTVADERRGAIVTGGAGGIGGAIVSALQGRGYQVAVLDIATPEAAAHDDIRAESARYFVADVTSGESVGEAVRHARSFLPALDLLVNAAGVSTMNHALALTEEEWELNMRVNARGVFLVCKEAIPFMPDGSSVVNIASAAGKRGAPLLAHYAASKFAVVGLTQSLALELAPRIRVNAVCPGYIRTAMQDREVEWEASLSQTSPEVIRAGYVANTPMRRLGMPEDIAKAVCFLASDDADFITGQSINVDGGLIMT